MRGRAKASAARVAALLASGYVARVVGGEPMVGGSNFGMMWVDGELVEMWRKPPVATPGIRLEGDGAVVLFATSSRESAEALLAAAERRVS